MSLTDLQQETLEALWERRLYRRRRHIYRRDRDAEFFEYFILDRHESVNVETVVTSAYKALCRKGMITRMRCRDWRRRCDKKWSLITSAGLQELFS